MSSQHALCAPSAYEGWSRCPGRPAMELGEPEQTSIDASVGTAAHERAGNYLRQLERGGNPVIDAGDENVYRYVTALWDRVSSYRLSGCAVNLMIEQKLQIGEVTGETDAQGTADAVLWAETAPGKKNNTVILEVWDFKNGAGVAVSVLENGQLLIYARAAWRQFFTMAPIEKIVLVIHQPAIDVLPQEWALSFTELFERIQVLEAEARLALSIIDAGPAVAVGYLNPGEIQCRFCRAKYKCPALAKYIHRTVFGDFQELENKDAVPLLPEDRLVESKDLPGLSIENYLSLFMSRIDLIEQWCTAIRAAVEKRLVDGLAVPGYKLVEGRRGARRWLDASAVETLLLSHRLMFDVVYRPAELRTPTDLEKKLKQVDRGLIMDDLKDFITQSEGKPSVASADDPRPPWSRATGAEFDTYDGSDLV